MAQAERPLHILILAHEYPPIPSPQSLRWAYLSRELCRLGHQVSVLCPDNPGYGPGGLPELPDTVTIHRVNPGLIVNLLHGRWPWRKSKLETSSITAKTTTAATLSPPATGALNWKGRLTEQLKQILSILVFPDYRALWLHEGRKALHTLAKTTHPDVVISSHQPACSLLLGLEAKALGLPWLADLGDPVLALYTPRRWRKRAATLERIVCARADAITVTSEGTRQLLIQRHGLHAGRCHVLLQGHDDRFDAARIDCGIDFDPNRIELLYTGSFYRFRTPTALIDAVVHGENMRLSVATSRAPDELVAAAQSHPEKFRLLGFQRHDVSLSMQRRATLLINIANADPVQIPGKLYEYLGSDTPILHITDSPGDGIGQLLEQTHRGISCADNPDDIGNAIAQWSACSPVQLEGSDEPGIAGFSWAAQAKKLEWLLLQLATVTPSKQPSTGSDKRH